MRLPVLITAHGVLGTGGQFQVVFEAEYLVNAVDEVDNAEDLIHQLIGSAEDVGIVLSEAADTHQARRAPLSSWAVYNTQLTHADGQVTIGVGLALVNQNTAGAVIGLMQ